MIIQDLPNKKQYCAAWKRLKTLPADAEITALNWFHQKASDVKSEFHLALHRRINERGGLVVPRNDMQWVAWKRDQKRLQDIAKRIRVYQFESIECQKLFSYKLSKYCED